MNRAVLARLDVDLDTATCRPLSVAEAAAFSRGQTISIEMSSSSATVRKLDSAAADTFRRNNPPMTVKRGRWLTVVRAFQPASVLVQLNLHEQDTAILAEAFGEAAADAWCDGLFDLTKGIA